MSASLIDPRQESLALPLAAPESPRDRLEQVIRIYAIARDDAMLLTATSGHYQDARGARVRTGLTLGDLKNILNQLDNR